MKYCTKCGKQLSDDAKFCTGCGHNFENGDSQSAPNTADSSRPEGGAPEKKRGKLPKGAIIGIICGIAAAVVLLAVFVLPGIIGGSIGASNDIVKSEHYYFAYDDGESIAYLKNGEITEFDAPEGLTDLMDLSVYEREECLALADDGIFLIKPDGESELFIESYEEIADINKYGVIYIGDDGDLHIMRYEGGYHKFAELDESGGWLCATSPDGSQTVCYSNGDDVFYLDKELNGKKEIDAGVPSDSLIEPIHVFNNGTFAYAEYDVIDDELVFNYVGESQNKEIAAFDVDGGPGACTAYFNSQGTRALISINDILISVSDSGECTLISEAARDGELHYNGSIEFPYNWTALTNISSFNSITGADNFNNFYYMINDYDDDETEIYYWDGEKSASVTSSASSYFYLDGKKIIYYDDDSALIRAEYKNGKLENKEELSDKNGTTRINPSSGRGYIYDGNLYYFDNGETIRAAKNAEYLSSAFLDRTGEYLAAAIDDSLTLYKDGEKSDTIDKNEIMSLLHDEISLSYIYWGSGSGSYIDPNEILYINDSQNLIKWTPDGGKETLLKGIEYGASSSSYNFVTNANDRAASKIILGRWELVSVDLFGTTMSAAELASADSDLANTAVEFKSDGTYALTSGGATDTGDYEFYEETVTLTENGITMTGEINGDTLELDLSAVAGTDFIATFTKK